MAVGETEIAQQRGTSYSAVTISVAAALLSATTEPPPLGLDLKEALQTTASETGDGNHPNIIRAARHLENTQGG